MARITVEDCLSNVTNRFALVRLASRRAKQLLSGQPAVTETKGNRAIVSALREIADGKVKFRPQSEEGVDGGAIEEVTPKTDTVDDTSHAMVSGVKSHLHAGNGSM